MSEESKLTTTAAVEAIFSWWQEVMSKPRSRLDEKRRKAILGRLRDGYSMGDLCDAIAGCAASEFHMGRNDRFTRYNDLELIFRDANHVDSFIDRWEQTNAHQQVVEIRADIAGKSIAELTPEERHAASARIKSLIKGMK